MRGWLVCIGVAALYNSMPATATTCHGVHRQLEGGLSGTISSDADGYGIQYSYGIEDHCSWSILCPSGSNVVFTARAISLAPNSQLRYVRVNGSQLSSDVGETFTYQQMSAGVHQMDVIFQAGGQSCYGFDLHYQCVYEGEVAPQFQFPEWRQCGQSSTQLPANVDQVNGTIANFGYQPYDSNQNCTWTIDCGTKFPVRISNLNGYTQDWDSVTISSGTTIASQGRFHLEELQTGSSLVTIRFTSTSDGNLRGFALDWECVGKPASGTAVQDTTMIRSDQIACIIALAGAALLLIGLIAFFDWQHIRFRCCREARKKGSQPNAKVTSWLNHQHGSAGEIASELYGTEGP